jgi:hypothetical protein
MLPLPFRKHKGNSMLKRNRQTVAFALTGIISLASFLMGGIAQAQNAGDRPFQMAQACGWYAVVHCGSSASARSFAQRAGAGRIINTSSDNFPNFQPGYFCVVQGPMDRRTALEVAADWRARGLSPSAYAKSSC